MVLGLTRVLPWVSQQSRAPASLCAHDGLNLKEAHTDEEEAITRLPIVRLRSEAAKCRPEPAQRPGAGFVALRSVVPQSGEDAGHLAPTGHQPAVRIRRFPCGL